MHKSFDKIKGGLAAEKLLTPAEIPNLDLYMDQLLTLINAKSETKAPLTKTMVNNYSKEKIIMPVKGKKYTKEQVLQIYTVFLLKNTLSMGEIKAALNGLYAEGDDEHRLEKAYTRFIEMEAGDVDAVFELLQQQFAAATDVRNKEEFFVTLLNVCSYSWLFQQIAQGMIKTMAEYEE